MEKNLLLKLPDFKGFIVLNTPDDIDEFFKNARESSDKKEHCEKLKKAFTEWTQLHLPTTVHIYAIKDDKPDFKTNDDIGTYFVYKCIVFMYGPGKAEVFKKKICQLNY